MSEKVSRELLVARGVSGQVARASTRGSRVSFLLAVAMLALIGLSVVLVPLLPSFDPNTQDLADALVPPFRDAGHVLGTDELGRDSLSRLVVGLRVSILVSLGAVAISTLIGTAIGLVAGYFRGRLDSILMAIGDTQLALPIVLLLIVIVATLGSSPALLVVVIGLTNWVVYGRAVRAAVLTLREREFVQAARCAGASHRWVIIRHLLPNVAGAASTVAAFQVGLVVTIESTLSYMGLGIQPPTPSLGLMINAGQAYLQIAPWLTILPCLAIILLICGVQLLAQALGARKER